MSKVLTQVPVYVIQMILTKNVWDPIPIQKGSKAWQEKRIYARGATDSRTQNVISKFL